MEQTVEAKIQAQLFALQDPTYQRFQQTLMPTMPPERVIGVRIPVLRKLAKTLPQEMDVRPFLRSLPHPYYEEDILHGLLIDRETEFHLVLEALEQFLPYVDNWATCDLLRPKALKKDRTALLPHIRRWMDSQQAYTIRYGIGLLLSWYLDDAFQPVFLEWVAQVDNQDYYVRMMVAWYFATALAKQPEAALPYLEQGRLAPWVQNKAIQKAIESRRITQEQKAYLRTLKQKKILRPSDGEEEERYGSTHYQG